jgi:hypothetical protein
VHLVTEPDRDMVQFEDLIEEKDYVDDLPGQQGKFDKN